MIYSIVSSLLTPQKGTPELISAYRIMPRHQISDLKSHGSFLTTSGAIKPTVPATLRMHSSFYNLHAKPKSPILTRGASVVLLTKIFLYFKSL